MLIMFISTILQSSSFTLVSRARNSQSIIYHAVGVIVSSTIWLMVIRQVVQHMDSFSLMAAYVIGSSIGSLASHWLLMKFVEKARTNDPR